MDYLTGNRSNRSAGPTLRRWGGATATPTGAKQTKPDTTEVVAGLVIAPPGREPGHF